MIRDISAQTQVQDKYIDNMLVVANGFVIERRDGIVYTNVPHYCVSHSPSGFEFGYAGSGPADLALNVLNHALVLMNFDGKVIPLYIGYSFALAWLVHQQFKTEFIQPLPLTVRYSRNVLSSAIVMIWIAEQRHSYPDTL